MVDDGAITDERDVDVTADLAPTVSERRGSPTFEWGGLTHIGGVRQLNEDSWFATDDVCVVADGMGGHEAGEVASGLAVQLVSEVFGAHHLDLAELPAFVSALNAAVLRRGAEDDTPGMGTTLVGVAVADNGVSPSAVVFHVGDSRCYRLHDGVLTQITSDHSHVQDLVTAGVITVDEAARHPLRNVVTRALGAETTVQADFHVLEEEDCRLLLCTDGLSGEIDDEQIAEVLRAHLGAEDAARRLVELTLEGPARDNVTAVVVDVRFPEMPTERSNETDVHRVVAGSDDTDDVDVTAERPLPVDVTVEPGTQPAQVWAPPRLDVDSNEESRRVPVDDAPRWEGAASNPSESPSADEPTPEHTGGDT